MTNLNQLKKKWLVYAGVGITLIGFGLCASVELAFQKHSHPNDFSWILWGTLSLSVLMSGLCFFGEAVALRALILQIDKKLPS